MKKNKNIFKRLTDLFKSGPTLRNKITAASTVGITADRSKNSSSMLFQKSVTPTYAMMSGNAFNLTERLMRYQDFNEMESTPEIASALDLIADETASSDENGQILHVFSENEKIKDTLEDLYYNIVNVDFNLRPWTRNLIKYGDFFLYNDVNADHGVTNVLPVPINEIEREEFFDKQDPYAVRFNWMSMGNRKLENWEMLHFRLLGNDLFLPYGNSMIDSARRIWRQLILMEDAMLVYRVVRAPERRVFYLDVGNLSADDIPHYVEETRARLRSAYVQDASNNRVDLRYNPLSIDEDFVVPVRGGDSGTKIDALAGGTNTAAIEDVEYLQKKLFSALKIPKAYLGYDEALCLTGDTLIPLMDGTIKTIQELSLVDWSGLDEASRPYVYSCDVVTGAPKPGKVLNAWQTKETDELFYVTIDNGQTVKCTANHPFLCRDGKYLRADELVAGQSLMALEKRLSKSRKYGGADLLNEYEMLLDTSTNQWNYTHKLVDKATCVDTVGKTRVIHHKDYNKRNNTPINLVEMTWAAHRKLHAQNVRMTLLRPDVVVSREPKRLAALKTPEYKALRSQQMKMQHADKDSLISQWVHGTEIRQKMSSVMANNWQNQEYRQLKTTQLRELWNDSGYVEKHLGALKKNSEYDIDWLVEFCRKHNVRTINQWRNTHAESVVDVSPVGIKYVLRLLQRNGHTWPSFAAQKLGLQVKKTSNGCTKNQSSFTFDDLVKFCTEHKVTSASIWNKQNHESIADKSGVSGTVVRRLIAENGFRTFRDFAKTLQFNHKVVSVERIKLEKPVPVYDIEVESWSNFLTVPELKLGEKEWFDGVFLHNSSKSTLAQEDVRFSRTVASIQKVLIAELNKLAIIHLYVKGFQGKELINFNLKLTNPSTIAQQQKLELWRTKFDIASQAPENLISRRFTRKNVLGLTDKQIQDIDNELVEEAIFMTQLENAGTVDAGSGGGGGGSGGAGGIDFGGGDTEPAPDLFGDEGASEGSADIEAEEPVDEEEPESIEAANLPIDEEDPDLELLLSNDEAEDDLIPEVDEPHRPIKISDRSKRERYNARRRQSARRAKSGLADVGMPALSKMVGFNKRASINDPDDRNFWRDPLGEAVDITTHDSNKPLFTNDILNTLLKMDEKLQLDRKQNVHVSRNVLVENIGLDVQEQIDDVVVEDFSAFIEVDEEDDN